ncbi:hypothetical protein L1987_57647 [Smallanthus sonchifolius]|uniref:Uncharacterized protein n=1 Tax=Smallanthus sonchifolius TaxID=185202 RepID=A0ACB9DD30_9ASTR|nr:hypothetical protein L1987_57647 [Smallanthus sonchifolius]
MIGHLNDDGGKKDDQPKKTGDKDKQGEGDSGAGLGGSDSSDTHDDNDDDVDPYNVIHERKKRVVTRALRMRVEQLSLKKKLGED